MKIGIGPYYFKNYPGREGAERMKRHGFDSVDFDWYANTENELYLGRTEAEFIENTKAWKKKFDDAGYTVHQIHGPWRMPEDETEEKRAERFEKMSKCLLACSVFGVKYMAIHPIMPFGVEKHTPDEERELYRINKDFFTRLAAVGEWYGVTVCLENMPFPSFPLASVTAILALVKEIDSPYLRMCLDTGHANIVPPAAAESVRILGKEYLKIMHVHDNMGVNDTHHNPYDGTIDWEDFSAALKEIGFDGVMSLETSMKAKYDSEEQREALEIELAQKAKKIAGRC